VRIAPLALVLVVASTALAADEVRTAGLTARIERDPWRLRFVDGAGQPVLSEASPVDGGPSGPLGFRTADGWVHATRATEVRRRRNGLVAVVETDDPQRRRLEVELAVDDPGIIALTARIAGDEVSDVEALGVGFITDASERFFGFGERSNAVDQRSNTVEGWVAEGPFQADERDVVRLLVPPPGFRPRTDVTYFPMPWLLSSHGYGVLVDNDETHYFRLASDRADAWSVEVTATPDGMVRAPAPDSLRLRVFAGPRPADVLARFTARVGRQPEPDAPWVLGPWWQPGGPIESNLAQLATLRAADAPVSVAQTYTHYLPCGDHQGSREAQRQRTAALHAAGVAVTTYFNPMICAEYQPAFDEAAAAGGLTLDSAGQVFVYPYTGTEIFDVAQFDFSVRAGKRAYHRLLAEAVEDGYDGWMEDFGEYTPLDSRSRDGVPGWATHNAYPTQYHCASYDFVRRQSRPVVRFQRSGWRGSARCAQVVWNGDPSTSFGFDGLESAVWNALNMGMSGISTWGSDIGGFFALGPRTLTPELLKRWVQFGAASTVMRMQRNGISLPPKVRPQIEDPDQIGNWKRWAKWHTQLYPYLVAATREHTETGLPVMRHLVLVHPDDAIAAGRHDEYLFGPDLLIAPVVTDGARSREVYLPAGEWVDLWRSAAYDSATGSMVLGATTTLAGGQTVVLPAPLDELPVLVRAGALLPLLPADVDTLADYGDPAPGVVKLSDREDRLDLLAFPRGTSSARMLRAEWLRSSEDDGRWELALRSKRVREYQLQASLATLERPFEPCAVEWRGRALPDDAWEYDPATAVLRVTFRGRRSRLVVRERCG
jgi:alpha-glucosidase (family GH31 glycosyl hydrolase)